MANNYTTNYPTTAEFSGDSVSAGTLPSTYDIIITPDAGYAVQASDFSIGSTLPPEVAQVVFTDTTTALDITNKVRARVHLASWYTMPATPTTGVIIEVDICGDAHQAQTSLQFTSSSTDVGHLTEAFTSAGTLATTVDGVLVTNTVSCDINRNTQKAVLKAVFTADSGYFMPSMPSFVIMSSDLKKWSSTTTNKVYNDSNKLTSVTFDFYYSIGTQSIYYSDGENIIWTIPELEADPVNCVSIHSAYLVGLRNQSVLPSGRQTLQLCVSGSENSTYNIKVETSGGKTYDFTLNDGTFNRELTVSATQTIYSHDEQLLRSQTESEPVRALGKNTHSIIIPYASLKCDTESQTYTITVTPVGSTFSNTSCTGTDPLTITLNQFGVVTTTVQTNITEKGTVPSSSVIKSLVDKNPLSYPSSFNPTDFPRSNTNNNGYFTYSSPLNYSTTDTTNGAFSGTAMILDTSYVTKKIEVGDAITGTNIDTDTTIAAVNVGESVYAYTLSKSPVTTVEDGVTVRITRTVGISRQPNSQDFYTAVSGGNFYNPGYDFTTNHTVTENTSHSTFVKLDGVDDLLIGLMVQGDSIMGYPTITGISGSEIILSTNQTLTTGDELIFSNEGMEIKISEINVTGAGTSTCLLNADGYIQRIGKSDTTAILNLDNLITTYAAPTAAAVAATATHCETIILEPLSTCTGHTGTLTIATTNRGAITNGGQSITYTAPTSGTSQTIIYTVSDGINASSSANITVTLTSY